MPFSDESTVTSTGMASWPGGVRQVIWVAPAFTATCVAGNPAKSTLT
jgi:hypothetical protein